MDTLIEFGIVLGVFLVYGLGALAILIGGYAVYEWLFLTDRTPQNKAGKWER
jgi:hypothetical protein